MGFDICNLYPSRSRRKDNQTEARATEQGRIAERRRQIDSISAEGIRDQEAAPLRDATAEFEESYRTLAEREHSSILTSPDPYFVCDPVPGYEHANAQTIKDHDQLNYELFQKARPQYFECDQNIATLKKYMLANGREKLITAKTFTAAFDRLLALNVLFTAKQIVEAAQQQEQAAAQHAARVRAAAVPAQTVWDISEVYTGHNRAKDLFEGWSPDGSNQRVRLTARQIDRLSVDEYKTFSRVSIVAKPDWARMDDRDPSFVANQFTELWIRNHRGETNE